MNTVFTCTDLCKNFRKKRALDGVTLSLEQGRIYGLVGLNGAGKTTLMRIMAGLIRPTSGSFTLFGESKGRALERSRRRVGFLIEDPVYFATMTAKQNLKAVAQIKAAKKVDYDSLLKAVGLEKESRSILNGYSTGMKQRYGLAAAMIGDPELLVLDEPTRGLDISGVREFSGMIRQIVAERNATMLISSHDLADLYDLATDFIFLHKGKIIEEITHSDLEQKCTGQIVLRTSDNEQAYQVLSKLTEELEQREDAILIRSQQIGAKEIAERMNMRGVLIYGLEQSGSNLAEYFTALIGGENDA